MSDLSNSELIKLLPVNLQNDPDIIAASIALDNSTSRLSVAIEKLRMKSDIDNAGEEVIDMLAYQRHVDYYDASLSLEKKRAIVKNARLTHRVKGTRLAVETLVADVFSAAELQEWFEYGGDPYKFKIVLEYTPEVAAEISELRQLIDTVKNLRSELEAIELSVTDAYDVKEQIFVTGLTYNYIAGSWVVGAEPIAETSTERELFLSGGGVWQ